MIRYPLSPDYDGIPDLPDHRDDEYHGGGLAGLAVGLCVVAAVIVWWLL